MLLRETRGAEPPEAGRSVLGLIEDLLGHTVRLLDQKLLLLRLEVEESLGLLMRHLAVLVCGGALLGLGLVLASIALALWIGNHLGSALAGFAATGGGFLLVGAVLVAVRLHLGVGPKRLVPERTVKGAGERLSMDQERSVDIDRVTRAMDATRESIRDTVDELKGRVQETADWRNYVAARPITSLLIAVACGLAAARIVVPALRFAQIPLLLAPRIIKRTPPPGLAATWAARLSGAAGLATQIAALPSLVSQVRQVVRRPERQEDRALSARSSCFHHDPRI